MNAFDLSSVLEYAVVSSGFGCVLLYRGFGSVACCSMQAILDKWIWTVAILLIHLLRISRNGVAKEWAPSYCYALQ